MPAIKHKYSDMATLASNLNPWALHVKVPIPIRLSQPFALVFKGATPEYDALIQKSSPTPPGFLPLWKGVVDAGSVDIKGTAFEKNMIMAETAMRLWNSAHSADRESNLERLRECHAILHHLLTTGLSEDLSMPSDPRYQPRCIRRSVLEDLNNAVVSVILQHTAEGIHVMTYSDEMAIASLRYHSTLKESTFLKKAWYNRQEALATGHQGIAYVRQGEEDMPSKELCLSAYRLLGQAAAARGCPDVNKFKGAQAVCLADLKVVFQFQDAELRRVQSQKIAKSTPDYGPPLLPDWMTTPPDIVALSKEAIHISS